MSILKKISEEFRKASEETRNSKEGIQEKTLSKMLGARSTLRLHSKILKQSGQTLETIADVLDAASDNISIKSRLKTMAGNTVDFVAKQLETLSSTATVMDEDPRIKKSFENLEKATEELEKTINQQNQ